MRFLLFLLLPLALFANSKVLNYNIYDRSDRVDVMITFDTPYEGSIKQNSTKNTISIKLEDCTIESAKIKNIDSPLVRSISIMPLKDALQIEAIVADGIKLKASKTADAYGLRLRLQKDVAQIAQAPSEQKLALPTKQDDEFKSSYYIAIAILLIGLGVVLYLRKKMPKDIKTSKTPWLFEENSVAKPTQPTPFDTKNLSEATIRFQKNIDGKNSVIMLDFMDQSYLLLMGDGNILLDKFTDNKPSSQNEFEVMLEHRYNQLDNFLNSDTKSAIDSYKQRASNIAY
ncbi:MAG: hypothetical protein RBS91_05725 [Sulfurimonadaceae bacterium]|jgi:hypothetical protein|nr:hypothetical protein [Sulfurimonadaceae bacterium]